MKKNKISKDLFSSSMTFTSVGDEFEEDILMETIHKKYATYDIRTKNTKYIKAKEKSNHLSNLSSICILFGLLFFFVGLIILGINAGDSGNAGPNLLGLWIGGGLSLVVGIIIFILSGVYSSASNKQYNIYKSFWDTEEYQQVIESIFKSEEKLREKALKKKANDLITVYDTLDDKTMKKNEKIKIIKKYIKED